MTNNKEKSDRVDEEMKNVECSLGALSTREASQSVGGGKNRRFLEAERESGRAYGACEGASLKSELLTPRTLFKKEGRVISSPSSQKDQKNKLGDPLS